MDNKFNYARSVPLLVIITINLIFAFGQNKVQYEKLQWNYLQSKHFSLYLHQNQSDLPYLALSAIEDAYTQLTKRFGYTHKGRIPLIIYGNPNFFAQTNIITEILPEDVGGFTEILKNRIAIPFNGSYNDLRHVLHHELVHAFQFGILYDQISGSMFTAGIQVPFWFMEGGAEYLSSGWDIEADMFMLDMTINSAIPLPGPELNGYLAYKGGQSFLFFLEASNGDSAFSIFLKEFRTSKAVELSMKKAFGKSSSELGKEWIKELKRIYWPEIGRRLDPSRNSLAVTSHLESRDHFNLRPRLAPSCSTIAFFSDHNDYTQILLTDKEGTIKNHVSQNGYGGYFESFHPFRSGICWSPDSRRLAFVTKDNGRDEIRIIDVINKKLLKTIKTGIPSISSPDWSGYGDHLVFSGVSNGTSDLYLYNLSSDTLIRLTSSIQSKSDPRFSPNGLEIIFTMEDTGMDATVPKSAYGRTPTDLYLLNLNTLEIRALTATPWNEKHPCFSPDGNSIAFISDRNGIDNIYIAPLDTISNARALTDYIGSCSHPDWTGSTIAFSHFQNQGWDIRLIESPMSKLFEDTLAVTRWIESRQDTSVHYFLPSPPVEYDTLSDDKGRRVGLKRKSTSKSDVHEIIEFSPTHRNNKKPTATRSDSSDTSQTLIVEQSDSILIESDTLSMQIRSSGDVSSILESAQQDSLRDTLSGNIRIDSQKNTSPQSLKTTLPPPVPYRLKFSPDVVSVGVGMSNYYSPAGQAMISLSDIMGDHRITFAGDIQGNFKDYMHFYLSYFFLRGRIDIGGGAYVSKDYSYSGIFADKLLHDFETGGFIIARYPFSLFSRIDCTISGNYLEREPMYFEGPIIKSTTLLPSFNYVFDNILWGITGPINGIRASGTITLSPPFDFINNPFLSVDIDFRHYFHIVKRFVWANRLFAGASIPLSDSLPARHYFLGGSENWIFYDVNKDQYKQNMSFTSHSDFVTPFRGWKYLDITGERAFLFNSEFRFPFVREVSLAWPLPLRIQYINGAVFFDAGSAWNKGESTNKLPLPNNIYGGFGFGMRANLGIFVLRFDRGWPTDWKVVGKPVNYFSLGTEF